jgi:DNA ligase (NAD+)
MAAAIQAAAYAYHNGLPLTMTDDEYDAAVDRLKALCPTHPVLAAVGAPVAAGDEVTLPIPLPSLNKIKADGTLPKWLGRFEAPSYHVSAKLDGCSALWFAATGQLYTRGDGVRGRDISAFVPYFAGLVRTSSTNNIVAVRGELILRTDSPVIPAGKLARNIVAGALNRKDADPALFREIRFVAYELIDPADKTPEEAYALLRGAGYEVARATVIAAADATEAHLSELFSTAEAKSPYQMDGIVVTPNMVRPVVHRAIEVRTTGAVNPADRVAWKTRLTATSATTTVRAVEWNVSASGILIPRVLFDTVTLAGANISAATGLHGRWIHDNAVGPGAIVEIRRAGDVIPQIVAVHVAAPAGAAMPVRYTWEASGVHIRPVGDDVAAESDQIRIARALAELGAENVGAGVVAKLYEAGFTTVGAIYAATQADFAARVAGCKAKSAEKIWTGLRCRQAGWTVLDLMCASCCMPRGVGRSKLQTLLDCNADPATWTAATLQAACPAGLSDKTIEEIVAAVPAFAAWAATNALTGTAPTPTPGRAVAAAAAAAATVVLTGFRDKALEAALVAAGHTVADAVTKKTTHVVHPDGPAPSSTKITKARDVGASVLGVSEFKAHMGL